MAEETYSGPDAYTDAQLGPNSLRLVRVASALFVIGQGLLTILLGTIIFSKRIRKRNWTMANLLFVTVLSSVPPLLL